MHSYRNCHDMAIVETTGCEFPKLTHGGRTSRHYHFPSSMLLRFPLMSIQCGDKSGSALTPQWIFHHLISRRIGYRVYLTSLSPSMCSSICVIPMRPPEMFITC